MPTCGNGLVCANATITVEQADGSFDDVQVYAVHPTGATDLGIVVYAHGQGPGGVANCSPDADRYTTPVARVLGASGHLAVAVHYRNAGDGAPGAGTLRQRDHHVRDARALLAAAHAARESFPDVASDRVALVGSSMGTWPALWAVSADPDLADLQETLDLRTTIVHGETGNHLANASRRCGLDVSTSREARLRFIVGAGLAVLRNETITLGLSEVTTTDLEAGQPLGDAMRLSLTDRGVAAISASFLEAADPSIPECAAVAGLPAECDERCVLATFLRRFGDAADPNDFLRALAREAVCAFTPERPDPGLDTGNRIITQQRMYSPAYSAVGPARVRRALSLLSEGDAHHNPAAQELLLSHLEALGIATPNPAPNPGPDCAHDDYEDFGRPHCGLDLIEAELEAALAGP
jgi:hypothetical protein